ncbi:MAG: hypothetical protein WCO86_14935, partial [Planctomycetota bacterium]
VSPPVRRFWTGKLTHAAHQLSHSLPRGGSNLDDSPAVRGQWQSRAAVAWHRAFQRVYDVSHRACPLVPLF